MREAYCRVVAADFVSSSSFRLKAEIFLAPSCSGNANLCPFDIVPEMLSFHTVSLNSFSAYHVIFLKHEEMKLHVEFGILCVD